MLNKICQTENIPLLNIVRREEHAELLKKEGATHVIVTTGDWVPQYQELVKTHGFNCLFDALGGGPVTDALISGLNGSSKIFIYGALEHKEITISSKAGLFGGMVVTGFMLMRWWYGSCSPER